MSRRDGAEKPQRSCLGCRTARDRDQLIRFVLAPSGEIVPDLDGRLPGRGAYTCISSTCLEAAVRQRQFSRGFKCDVAAPPAPSLVMMVARLLKDRIIGSIGLANKAGNVVSGGSMVSDAVKSSRKPGLVLLATDVSEAIGERIESLAAVNRIPVLRVLSKDDFGAVLGKAPRSAVAIRPGGFVSPLVRSIERYRNFLGEVGQV